MTSKEMQVNRRFKSLALGMLTLALLIVVAILTIIRLMPQHSNYLRRIIVDLLCERAQAPEVPPVVDEHGKQVIRLIRQCQEDRDRKQLLELTRNEMLRRGFTTDAIACLRLEAEINTLEKSILAMEEWLDRAKVRSSELMLSRQVDARQVDRLDLQREVEARRFVLESQLGLPHDSK